ncbi:unannotated protein [freshwater metagenome]|uniref:Unannotated protein n=1 Tax=freshwater metagenome TaxID=449393 RepID=A0A6J6WP50_9ZZZZ
MSIALRAGNLECISAPELGVPILSIKHRGNELLAPPSCVDVHTVDGMRGMPILAPWANRLRSDKYSALGLSVDLAGLEFERDANALPLHGTLAGRGEWVVTSETATSCALELDLAADELTYSAFPFAALMRVELELSDSTLSVATTLVASGETSVPACFGWHPYFQISNLERNKLRVRRPSAMRVALDDRGLPTQEHSEQPAIEGLLGKRSADDLLLLGDDRKFVIESSERRLSLNVGSGYEALQIWIPEGESFICAEPMVVPVAGLSAGLFPVAEPGTPYRAEFSLEVIDI